MKKILVGLFSLFATVTLAQNYPSPTYKSLILQNPLAASSGGTGVANTGTLTLGGNFTTSGTYPLTLTLTGSTNLTFPTSGTLITAGSVSGTYAPIASPTFTGTVTVPSGAALGTPASATLTNATGLPVASGVSGLGTGVATALGSAVTGSGGAVLATSPSIASPTITSSFTATGLVTLADHATQAANTLEGNGTGSTASPTALAVPSCSTSSSGLQWASGTGFGCNSSINAATLGNATFAAPGAIGSGTAGTGAFTTLTASGAVSGAGITSLLAPYALLASPTLTGTPTAPTASVGTSTTQIATTAFAQTAASAPATPVAVGTSVYPTIVPPVNTTATSTNGSPTITVTSATGITTGMTVYATFAPTQCSSTLVGYFSTYVTSISGNTITMSCNATATNSTAVAVQFGQQRYSTTSTALANDVGVQTLKVGPASQGNSASWLGQVATGEDYRTVASAQILGNPGGGYALVVGSRASDSSGGAAPFPLIDQFYADSWSTTTGGEAAYFQSVLSSGTAGTTEHVQMEQSINSLWPTVGENPYSINGTNITVVHRMDCGTGQTGAQPNTCGVAEDIVPNPVGFQDGIVFGNGAINTGSGTTVGNAIEMPLWDGIVWYASSSAYSTSIYSPTASVLDFSANTGAQFNWQAGTSSMLSLNSGEIQPSTTNSMTLGDSSHIFSGLYTGTISATGAITPSTTAGIVGTTSANSANAGSVGEYQSSTTSGTSLTSATAGNCSSLTLTAGDWDVGGTVQFIPAGSTVVTGETASISTVSATNGPNYQAQVIFITHAAGAGDILNTGYAHINVSASTTVYAVGDATFTTSTLTCNGWIHARRVR